MSAKAEKMSTLRLPGLMGLRALSRIVVLQRAGA